MKRNKIQKRRAALVKLGMGGLERGVTWHCINTCLRRGPPPPQVENLRSDTSRASETFPPENLYLETLLGTKYMGLDGLLF